MSDPLSPLDDVKRRVLEAALPLVPFDGWSERMLREAGRTAGASEAEVKAAFPRGVIDLVVAYADDADGRMTRAMAAADLRPLKVRERVTLGVRKRIEAVMATKEASRRAAAIFALPQNSIDGMQSIYRTVDAIWRAVGDTSSDFNFYTKRALLAGVFASTMLHWFADSSEDAKDTWAFLDARIGDVMQIEKFKATAFKFAEGLPNPLSILGSFRYPRN
jgi:ubiquinone biosynthesis protein COQ9